MTGRGMVRFAFCLLLLFVLSEGLVALERAKSLPRSTPTNEKDPYYLPSPYPKNDKELLKDLVHFLKWYAGARQIRNFYSYQGGDVQVPQAEYRSYYRDEVKMTEQARIPEQGFSRSGAPAYLLSFIRKGRLPKTHACRITRVFNRWHRLPYEYGYLIELSDKKTQKTLSRWFLSDSGHVVASDERGSLPALFSVLDDAGIQSVLHHHGIHVDSAHAAEKAQIIQFAKQDLLSPYLLFEGSRGETLLVSEKKGGGVFLAERLSCKVETEAELISAFRVRQCQGEQFGRSELFLLDSINDEIYRLKKQ